MSRWIFVMVTCLNMSWASAPEEATTEIYRPVTQEMLDREAEILRMGFVEPKPEKSFKIAVQPKTATAIPQNLYSQAMAYFQANQSKFSNKNYVTVVDFSKFSGAIRMWVVSTKDGSAEELHVAHGKNSDPTNSGYATKFSNVIGSLQSSLGAYLTAEQITDHGTPALVIDGLSTTNSNARQRAVWIHGATYVYNSDSKPGRSWGCFAIPLDRVAGVVSKIRGGSLLYVGLSGAK